MRYLIPRPYHFRSSWTTLLVSIGLVCLCFAIAPAMQKQKTGTPGATGNGAAPAGKTSAATVKKTRPRSKPAGGAPAASTDQSAPSASDELIGKEQPKPIEVYVTWFDKDTVLLAISHPSIKRVVVGIATPSQPDVAPLNKIPGFKEIVPDAQLAEFRNAIVPDAAAGKYKVHSVPFEGASLSFTNIDKKFIEYLRSATTDPADLEVWDITSVAEVVRVIFMGNLVLVKPAQISSPQSRAENAIIQLLTSLAANENQGIHPVSLQKGCVGVDSGIQDLRQNPLSEEGRKFLRNLKTGKMSGILIADTNEYSVTNSGWVMRILQLDVKAPSTSESDFKVTTIVGEKEVPDRRRLELPPCEVARISVEPQHWYNEFSSTVFYDFNENETKLTVSIPEVSLSMVPFFVGAIFIAGIGIIIWLLYKFFPRKPATSRSWGSTIGPHVTGPVRSQTVYDSEASAATPWWKFWQRSRKKPDDDQPTAKYLQQRLDQYKERHDEFINEIGAALPRLASIDQTLSELAELEKQLKAAQGEHERWQLALKDLGDSPETIVKSWQNLSTDHQTVSGQVFKIEALARDTVPSEDGKQDDVFQALKRLKEEVPRLKQYEKVSAEIGELVNCTKSGTAVQGTAEGVLATVKSLRSFTDSVLLKLAEPLQVDGEPLQFSDVSLAENQKRFATMVKARESLASLETDERIHQARLVSLRILKAGKQLDRIEKTNAQYGRLFSGTGMELTELARQLQDVSLSLNLTLARVSSRQVRSDGERFQGDLNINGVLSAFMMKLLSDEYDPLRDMLRLYQVLEVYCRDSSDPVASRLHLDSAEFRKNCQQVLSDFEGLGIHFHKIRFLEDPKDQDFLYTEAPSVPRLQNNRDLFNLIQSKLDSGFRDNYWNTVADVAAWGFECELDPQRNLKTDLWLWRSVSTGLSEK